MRISSPVSSRSSRTAVAVADSPEIHSPARQAPEAAIRAPLEEDLAARISQDHAHGNLPLVDVAGIPWSEYDLALGIESAKFPKGPRKLAPVNAENLLRGREGLRQPDIDERASATNPCKRSSTAQTGKISRSIEHSRPAVGIRQRRRLHEINARIYERIFTVGRAAKPRPPRHRRSASPNRPGPRKAVITIVAGGPTGIDVSLRIFPIALAQGVAIEHGIRPFAGQMLQRGPQSRRLCLVARLRANTRVPFARSAFQIVPGIARRGGLSAQSAAPHSHLFEFLQQIADEGTAGDSRPVASVDRTPPRAAACPCLRKAMTARSMPASDIRETLRRELRKGPLELGNSAIENPYFVSNPVEMMRWFDTT